jgi:signal transduction histidine kinase
MNEGARRSVDNLLAGLAHELNTPLGAIRSNRDVLRRVTRRLSDIVADDTIDRSEVEQVRELVAKLVEIVEIDRAAVDFMRDVIVSARACWRPDEKTVRCVDLHEGLDSVLLLLRHQFGGRIEVVREYGDLPDVECYPSQVNQVFLNLLLNACQAIPESGTVTIRSRLDRGRVAVEIIDTGTGIDPELLDRIFEPGFTTKGERSGMGLGLDICRRIIEEQGGTIEVRSTPGTGSTFTVMLPVRCKEPRADGERS